MPVSLIFGVLCAVLFLDALSDACRYYLFGAYGEDDYMKGFSEDLLTDDEILRGGKFRNSRTMQTYRRVPSGRR